MIHSVDLDVEMSWTKFRRLFEVDGRMQVSSLEDSGGTGRFHNMRSAFAWGPGKGFGGSSHPQKLRAAFGAMGEALERYCLCVSHPDIKARSYKELQERALDPASFRLYADEQPVLQAGDAFNLTRDSVIDWTRFSDAIDGQPILLPSYFNSGARFQFPIYFSATTSGNACGQTPAAAKYSALMEFMERDAAMFYWWTKNAPLEIDLSEPSPRLRKILDMFTDVLPQTKLLYTRTDFAVATVMVVFRGELEKRRPLLAVSGGASLDPITAIERGLAELLQCLQAFRRRGRFSPEVDYGRDYDLSVWDFLDHVHLYSLNDKRADYEFMLPAQPEVVHWSELPSNYKGTPEANLEFMASEFARTGNRLYFKDMTTRQIRHSDLHVFRAFSPDLISIEAGHRCRPMGYPRLTTLPRLLNLKNQPKLYAELNDKPHPYP